MAVHITRNAGTQKIIVETPDTGDSPTLGNFVTVCLIQLRGHVSRY